MEPACLTPLCLARHPRPDGPTPAPGDVITRMLETMGATAPTSDAYLCRALPLIRRGFGLDFGAVYLPYPARPGCLRLHFTDTLPPAFADIAAFLPDYADIADLPFNGDHGGCWGDFFAPVARAFGMRAWLFLSLTSGPAQAVAASILLGSRSPARFTPPDAAALFTLARALSALLSARFP